MGDPIGPLVSPGNKFLVDIKGESGRNLYFQVKN